MKKVCVIGLGYIGLPTASLLATKGFEVHGVDVNPRTVETINSGRIHIVEPDLDVMVRSAVQSGRLRASLEPAPAEVFILAVPTPLGEGNRPDLSYVDAAVESVAPHLAPGNLIILESTSPVGTTLAIAQALGRLRPDLVVPQGGDPEKAGEGEQIYLAHCPERVLPGAILRELVDNDRVVGGLDAASTQVAHELYKSFVGGKILLTDAATAEMAKLTENAFRDVNIAFANEISMLAERFSVDPWELIALANHHPRVEILQPGPGVGGHCIPIDPWFLIDSAQGQAPLLQAAREVNLAKEGHVLEAVGKLLGSERRVVACLGLAYKNDVDDLRESPSVHIVEALADGGRAEVWVVEPYVEALPERLAGKGVQLVDLDRALDQADVLVTLVRHRPFLAAAERLAHHGCLVDACGLLRS
jgi:UDP-N-acetyl-D-mannosaminuronic acid dehydrogenase